MHCIPAVMKYLTTDNFDNIVIDCDDTIVELCCSGEHVYRSVCLKSLVFSEESPSTPHFYSSLLHSIHNAVEREQHSTTLHSSANQQNILRIGEYLHNFSTILTSICHQMLHSLWKEIAYCE